MITCRLLLCAQGVVRDADHGGISIFNIIEGVQAAGFPFFIQQMDVFTIFEREPGDPAQHEVRFRLAIGDTEIFVTPLAIDFQTGLRNRSTVRIQGLVLPSPGVLRVSVYVGENEIGVYTIGIEQIALPRVEAHQEPAGLEGGV